MVIIEMYNDFGYVLIINEVRIHFTSFVTSDEGHITLYREGPLPVFLDGPTATLFTEKFNSATALLPVSEGEFK
jgi:hypothetical protein